MRATAACLVACLTVACASSTPAPVATSYPPPSDAPRPPAVPSSPAAAPAVPDRAHVTDFGFWLDAGAETRAFTTFRTIYVDLDADPSEWQTQLVDDGRGLVWFVSPFRYTRTARSLNGYVYRDDFAQQWQTVRPFIAARLAQTRAIWLVDEPDSAAWDDRVPGDAYNPNLYNADITRAAAIIHADIPTVAVALNYADAALELEVAAGLNLVGIEAYRDDWRARVSRLEAKTTAPVWLLAPAFADPTWTTDDATLAQRVRDQWAAAQTDRRITGFYPFLWCCDDTTTGNKAFYAVGGVNHRLPLLLEALSAIGRQVQP
jgi:hypothetical protein